MKQERVILSFVMVLIGLLVAGVIFYFYQSGKQTPKLSPNIISPTPKQQNNKETVFLNITSPTNEIVVNNKTLTVSGKTNPNSTVIIITKSDQQIFKASQHGDFNGTVTLEADQNLLTVISVLPNGESKEIKTTVTYSTSNF